MVFGLLNADSTYPWMMNMVFMKQLERNMKVYVDNMIVKNMKWLSHLDDLRQFFETVRHHNISLNPTKCTFGLNSKISLNIWLVNE